MKLIITEKPSVAADINKIVGGSKKEGYIEGTEYSITWAFGHLLELSPELMPKEWNINNLPIFPSEFLYSVSKDKNKQYQVIKNLLKTASEVIIATDAGREGELIARLILNKAGWTKWDKTFRFWSSEALSEQVIKKQLSNLKSSKEYDSLYYSAITRQHSDWIAGINLTQLISIKANDRSVWSVGRVQTPTLRLIVDRDNEIKYFKPKEYWKIIAVFEKSGTSFETLLINAVPTENKADSEDDDEVENNTGKLNEAVAKSIFSEIEQEKNGIVSNVKKESKKEAAPLLHSLTSLQREANNAFGYSAQQTLDIAQSLYEKHKCISYPRTDSQHLGESSHALAKEVLTKLNMTPLISRVDTIGKRIFDSSKLTDHHAILPLLSIPNGLSEIEKNIYELVSRKFVGAFMPDYEFEQTSVFMKVNTHIFYTSGKVDLSLGWKVLYKTPGLEKERKLPLLTNGESLIKSTQKLEQKFTTPPPYHNEASILRKMEVLGLGTPATRASVLEKLINVRYIIREKKALKATDKAVELILKLNDSLIAQPELTANWERKLEDIYKLNKGLEGYNHFISDIKQLVREEIIKLKDQQIQGFNTASPKMLALAKNLAKQKGVKIADTSFDGIKTFIDTTKSIVLDLGKCSCGNSIKDSLKAYNCDCGKVVWKVIGQKKITPKQAEALMQGKEIFFKGLKTKEGKSFDATLFYNTETKKIEYKFNNK